MLGPSLCGSEVSAKKTPCREDTPDSLLPLYIFWAFLLTVEDISSLHPSHKHSTLHVVNFHTHRSLYLHNSPSGRQARETPFHRPRLREVEGLA